MLKQREQEVTVIDLAIACDALAEQPFNPDEECWYGVFGSLGAINYRNTYLDLEIDRVVPHRYRWHPITTVRYINQTQLDFLSTFLGLLPNELTFCGPNDRTYLPLKNYGVSTL